MSKPWPSGADCRTALFSAVNISGMGAVLFSLAAGPRVSAALYFSVIVIGAVNKLTALRTGGHTRDALLFKPELTATVLMVASGLNALVTVLGVVAAHYDLVWLQAYTPMAFNTEVMGLVFACAWAAGATGDYFMKLTDRRRYQVARAEHVMPIWRNPILWFTLGSLSSNIAIMDLQGASRTLWQQGFGGLSVLAGCASVLVIARYAARPGPATDDPRLTAKVSVISALAALLAALQLAAGGLDRGLTLHVALFFIAQLLFMTGYLLIGREIHAKSLIAS